MKGNGYERRPIHVLQVLGNAIVGGMENYVRNLLAQLPPEEFQISLVAPFESAVTADLRRQGYEVFVTNVGPEPSWRSIQHTVEVVRERKVDLLHAHLANAHMLAGISGGLAQRAVVATLHSMGIDELELSVHRLTGSHLIAVCRQAYTQARSLGVAARDLTLIYNGVHAQRFHPGNDGAQFRERVGVPREAPLIGFAGRLSHEKGPDMFVQAADFVARRHGEAHFVLVGTGPMEGELRETIARLQLQERVHLAGLWEDMTGVFPALDVLVQTSRAEGTPLVLLEGMASGKPVVAMEVGGVIEVVEVGTTGLLSGRGDWIDVGEKVLALLQQPDALRQMGQAARQRVLERFTVQESAARTAALFRKLVKPRRLPAAARTVT